MTRRPVPAPLEPRRSTSGKSARSHNRLNGGKHGWPCSGLLLPLGSTVFIFSDMEQALGIGTLGTINRGGNRRHWRLQSRYHRNVGSTADSECELSHSDASMGFIYLAGLPIQTANHQLLVSSSIASHRIGPDPLYRTGGRVGPSLPERIPAPDHLHRGFGPVLLPRFSSNGQLTPLLMRAFCDIYTPTQSHSSCRLPRKGKKK